MKDEDLERLLLDAKSGDGKAILTLFDKYRGMIRINSIYNGEVNYDLEQDIICKVIESIFDFKI